MPKIHTCYLILSVFLDMSNSSCAYGIIFQYTYKVLIQDNYCTGDKISKKTSLSTFTFIATQFQFLKILYAEYGLISWEILQIFTVKDKTSEKNLVFLIWFIIYLFLLTWGVYLRFSSTKPELELYLIYSPSIKCSKW